MSDHTYYIRRCLQLAKNGLGTTGSNPMVGCVLVFNNRIIGEGWHYKAGQAHAEVNAIHSVKDKSLLKKATIYVSLEPCSHFGKTPPCSDLIIKSGIPKVVIGTADPFLKVSGRGIQKLKAAGCEVVVGVLEEECYELNKRFFTFHTKKRPYIFLKWAETADGFIAPKYTTKMEREPVWVTNEYAKQWVHKQRAAEQAILVGTQTVIKDNPTLTTRLVKGSHSLRVVLDLNHRIPSNSTLFLDGMPTVVITSTFKENTNNITYKVINTDQSLVSNICNILYDMGIQSVIIEGGKQTLTTFIETNLWDEAYQFKGNTVFFTSGIKAPKLVKKGKVLHNFASNTLTHYIND